VLGVSRSVACIDEHRAVVDFRLTETTTTCKHRAAGDAEEAMNVRYLCLVYQEEAMVNARVERRCHATEEELAYREELWQSGHLIAASPLQSVQSATTIRVRNGTVTITDGPFAESKEQMGGCYLIEARDLNEAIRIAARMPAARLGSIEVRPLKDAPCS
jgi:hypothetical protein